MPRKPALPAFGDCVRVPDGRIGRVRAVEGARARVRLRDPCSGRYRFLWFDAADVRSVACPAGWMSADGYRRYYGATLAKMEQRLGRAVRRR
ncbi:MAG: hypothetical protein ABFC67_07690 [Mizugakiibacter sp.]|uniref:hypothetical protein n=1 Tax=Mizugakiibacter sp. TaxID=1972610 RepID=UPI0031C5C373|nr:hypothetical protein [Xanthomonadaceae bacterium]